MKIYIAQWPNGTISIVSAKTEDDLLLRLDSEACPSEAKIFRVPNSNGNIHIVTSLKKENGEYAIDFDSGEYGQALKEIGKII
jgi:hypothetical protein